jgi:hypothetical protein
MAEFMPAPGAKHVHWNMPYNGSRLLSKNFAAHPQGIELIHNRLPGRQFVAIWIEKMDVLFDPCSWIASKYAQLLSQMVYFPIVIPFHLLHNTSHALVLLLHPVIESMLVFLGIESRLEFLIEFVHVLGATQIKSIVL